MHSCAQLQLASTRPLLGRSDSGQQGNKPMYRSPQLHKLAKQRRPSPQVLYGRSRLRTTTASAAPIGELAFAPSLFPVLLRAFSAGLLLYSSLRWASARSDRIQASVSSMLGPMMLPGLAVLTGVCLEQVEQNIAQLEKRQAEQKAKLDRLRGKTDLKPTEE